MRKPSRYGNTVKASHENQNKTFCDQQRQPWPKQSPHRPGSPGRRALRLYFVLPSILPALLGGVMAWAQGYPLHLLHFALVVIGVTVNHFGLNLVDDVLDYRHAVDLQKGEEKNFFTGGSGVLPEGLLKDTQMLKVAGLFFVTTAVIGAYLTYACGWPVLVLGLFGMASSIFYTTPPIRFGYRGFGELGLLVNFGPVIVMGSYYVQAQTLAIRTADRLSGAGISDVVDDYYQ